MKIFILLFFSTLFTVKSVSAQTSVQISYVNDSLFFVGCPSFPPPVFTEFTMVVDHSGYSIGDTFQFTAYFGDGTYQSYFLTVWGVSQTRFITSFDHAYLSLGSYDVSYVVEGPDGNMDSIFVPAEVILTSACSAIGAIVYVDYNSNCIYDGSDSIINNIPVWLYNNSAVYGMVNWQTASIPTGLNYTAIVNTAAIQQLGYTMTCPVSGMINFTGGSTTPLAFAVNCNSNYDLRVHAAAPRIKAGNSAFVQFFAGSTACLPQSGTYQLTLDTNLSFVNAMIPPSSVSGSVLQWNFTGLSSLPNGTGVIYNGTYVNPDPALQIGDSVCIELSITPTVGDVDTSNNWVRLCSPVLSAWDPNFKDVTPRGTGPTGEIQPGTWLTYTIGFQNTGNDTARHVYILDTLDSDLDLATLQIIATTHSMQYYVLDGNVLKFDYRNIYLPDSGINEPASHGFVVYKILPRTALVTGTSLVNGSSIFFDSNPAVLTNQVLNTITLPSGVSTPEIPEFSIVPNPSDGPIRMEFQRPMEGKIEVFSVLGACIISKEMNGNSMELDLSQQPDGLYFVQVLNSSGRIMKKLLLQ